MCLLKTITSGRFIRERFLKSKFFSAIYILFIAVALALFASCGDGGGGGGGAVSYAPNSNMPHNGGGVNGWGTGTQTGGGFGGTSIEEQNATLLIGQVPALDVTNVNIVLYVNGECFEINNVNETTTTEVLPKISIGDTVSGTAYIYVAGEEQPREALLDPQAIGFDNTLKFKVPYKYRCIDRDTVVDTGTYFYADGIDLSAHTGVRVAGWLCSDGTMHYGGYVSGVRGDIELTSVYKIAVTSDVPEISSPSSLITTLGITSDSGGTALKPATAQLSVYGSDNYTYSVTPSGKVDLNSGVVSIASGYMPPLTGETVTITVTDNDDATLYATVDLTISSQCVLAMYKDKASHDAETSPDYTKIIGGSDGTTASGNLYDLAGALIEANKGAQTGNTEQISDWKRTTPMPMKVTKTSSIPISADTKVYALYEMSVSINKEKIAKPSTLLASLNITQDSTGRAVMPNSAQLTVTGSDGYTFSSSPSGRVNITPGGVVTIAGDPSIRGETVTITATDSNDSTISAQCTIKICKQAVCAIYIDKDTCDATNGTPGYTKILDNDVDPSTSPGMNVTPISLIGTTFESQRGKTISAWQYVSSPYTPMVRGGAWWVDGDRKIYAGWPISGIDTSEIVLWRFTDNASERQGSITRPNGTYSGKWVDATTGADLNSCPISATPNGATVGFSVTETANLTALETSPGVNKAKYRISLSSDPASFTDVPVTVKDAMYVNTSGELCFVGSKTLPSALTITQTKVPGHTITKIADNAFKNNTNITSVSISGAIAIGEKAFDGCSSLNQVVINGATALGWGAFSGTHLNSVTITNLGTTTFGGFDYANTGTADVIIPSGVTTVSGFAASKVRSVTIPATVNRIEGWAFDDATCTINFSGTVAQWEAINKIKGNASDSPPATVHCSGGDCNYWSGTVGHY